MMECPQGDDLVVTVIGEALVDIVNDPRRDAVASYPGGSPLNVAIGCSRLDIPTTLVTQYADDPHGIMINEHLVSNGVRIVNSGARSTSTAAATLDEGGGAEYTFDLAWDIHPASRAALTAITQSDHVHTGSIATVLAPGSADTYTLIAAARGHATISFDPNCRPSIAPDVVAARALAERFVAVSDFVKASDEDLLWLYPNRTADESLKAWLRLGPAFVVMTRGAAGPVVFTHAGRLEMPAPSITVADTVGAGDSFMSALISGLAQHTTLGEGAKERLRHLTLDELQDVIPYATKAAAITCSRPGADPPSSAELGPLRAELGATG